LATTLIVDAAPLVAVMNERDPDYQVVHSVLREEPGQLVIPAPVSAEADYMIRTRLGALAERGFLAELAGGRFAVAFLTRDEHETALRVHDRYLALDLGLADLSVIVLAARFKTDRLLTFDQRDFRPVQPLTGGHFTLLPDDRGA
jgi:predicted nucleic acid-binding protein